MHCNQHKLTHKRSSVHHPIASSKKDSNHALQRLQRACSAQVDQHLLSRGVPVVHKSTSTCYHEAFVIQTKLSHNPHLGDQIWDDHIWGRPSFGDLRKREKKVQKVLCMDPVSVREGGALGCLRCRLTFSLPWILH